MSRPPVTPPLPGEAHKNITSLAAELGYSVAAFTKWRHRFQDAPDTLHADKWRAFIKEKGLGIKGAHASQSREELTNKKLASEVRLNEIKISKEERKLIPAEEIESFLLFDASKTKSAVYQMVAETAPKCAGLEAGEIRGIMRSAADAICISMQTTIEDWQAQQEEARLAAEQATEASER